MGNTATTTANVDAASTIPREVETAAHDGSAEASTVIDDVPVRKDTTNSDMTRITHAYSSDDTDNDDHDAEIGNDEETMTNSERRRRGLEAELERQEEGECAGLSSSIMEDEAEPKRHPHDNICTRKTCRCCWGKCVCSPIQCFGAGLFFIIVCKFCLIVALLIGSAVEMRGVHNTPGTLDLYETTNVCAAHVSTTNKDTIFVKGSDGAAVVSSGLPWSSIETYPTAEDAHAQGNSNTTNSTTTAVVHCGSCGQCSNQQDASIQAVTKESLAATTYRCALRRYGFKGRRAVRECMEERVGFSPDCAECWMENIYCASSKCFFTCVKQNYLFKRHGSNKEDGSLNDCYECDEKLCGRNFIECSGSNRRRLGIESDIGRDANKEVCTSMDFDWNGMA